MINKVTQHLDNASSFNGAPTEAGGYEFVNIPHQMVPDHHFLHEQPQMVKIGNTLSKVRTLSNGCPQGCVSSPLLYIIYTNDCASSEENCHIIKYADDTAILGLLNNPQSEENYINQINKFVKWCGDNFLELNISKTKEEIFDFRRNSSIILNISIHD